MSGKLGDTSIPESPPPSSYRRAQGPTPRRRDTFLATRVYSAGRRAFPRAVPPTSWSAAAARPWPSGSGGREPPPPSSSWGRTCCSFPLCHPRPGRRRGAAGGRARTSAAGSAGVAQRRGEGRGARRGAGGGEGRGGSARSGARPRTRPRRARRRDLEGAGRAAPKPAGPPRVLLRGRGVARAADGGSGVARGVGGEGGALAVPGGCALELGSFSLKCKSNLGPPFPLSGGSNPFC